MSARVSPFELVGLPDDPRERDLHRAAPPVFDPDPSCNQCPHRASRHHTYHEDHMCRVRDCGCDGFMDRKGYFL